jgi:protein-tyrosine phosphatase
MESNTSSSASIFARDCTRINITTNDEKEIVVYLSGSPKPSSIESFSRFMKDKGVTDILCFCSHEYDNKKLANDGIKFHSIMIQDGKYPDPNTIEVFDKIITGIINEADINDKEVIINMQCQSGLGRAPTMLAYFMITRCGYKGIESISALRRKRKGVLNMKQVKWLVETKFKTNSKKNSTCAIL